MKIAIISDIHGNLEALKATINVIEKKLVDQIICLGDTIAKGIHPHECIKLIKEKNKENKNIKYMVQIFDGNNTEEKVELENSEKLVNKDLAIRFNKKVKIFC